MYVRLISISGADASKRERMVQTMRERVLPTLQGYDGFAGYIGLYGEDNQRAGGVLLWESREAAEAAEETLAERRREITSGLGLTVESADLYEAPVVDLQMPARA